MRIAIIGAGPLGIAAGHELLRQGFRDFILFEKCAAAGGTWHIHRYPGLACDVWAHSYTFSYAPNPDWSASFVAQAEIEAYLQDCHRRFGLLPHTRFNTRIVKAVYHPPGESAGPAAAEPRKAWTLYTEAGEALQFDAVINAMGNQHTPVYPDVEGLGRFQGPSWHSTHWDQRVDLAGKRIAVVGSAAAAVQIVPQLATVADRVYVVQRTANWILPRGARPYAPWQRSLFRRFPVLTRMLRALQTWLMSFIHEASMLDSKHMARFEKMGRKYRDRVISDPSLRADMTPESRFACKRPLASDNFYQALNRANVELVASAMQAETPRGLICAAGQELDVDVIIYCTGYEVMDFARIEVRGEDGRELAEQMQQQPQAYKGILVEGFPNWFLGMGPNAVVLSVSYFLSAEANVAAIVRLLSRLRRSGKRIIRVNTQHNRDYNSWLQSQLPQFAWGNSSCSSYYRSASGHSPFLYPGNYASFKRMRDSTSVEEFELLP